MNTTKNKIKWHLIATAGIILAMTGCQKDLLKTEASSPDLTKMALANNIAGEINLAPVADAFVQDGSSSNSNYGALTYLVAKDDAPGYRRSIYLRFDLTSLPKSSSIQSARIELVGGVINATDTANAKWIYSTTTEKDWSEKTITWNNAPAVETKIGEVNGKFKVNNSVVYFDIPATVLQNVADTDGKLSVKIEARQKTAGTRAFYSDFQSKEVQNVDLSPRLKVNYMQLGSDFYRNLIMDKVTFDSIQSDLVTSPQAQALINSQVTEKANIALSSAPAPVTKYSDANGRDRIIFDSRKTYALALQYFLFQRNTNAQQYIDKAKEFLLSWAAVNVPESHTPNETMYLPFYTGYSLIRAKIDANSRTTIDNWFRKRYDYYKGRPVRTNNWETIRNLFMLDIAYILNEEPLINKAITDFSKHHDLNYRADGASVDFLGRDAFAYHIYDMEFIGHIGRTLYINRGRNTVDSLVKYRSKKWVNLRINTNDTPVLGGSISEAVYFLAPYVMDPSNNTHLEFVNTEWAPDKSRSDYNKPFAAWEHTYAFVEMASIMKDDMFAFMKKVNPNFTRYTDLRYYINSFGPSLNSSSSANVTLYGDVPFRGWYKELGVGSYSLANLTALGVVNDQLSSISIPKGYKVTLFEHGDFNGNSVTLTKHTIDLSKLNFNNTTSSLVIEKL